MHATKTATINDFKKQNLSTTSRFKGASILVSVLEATNVHPRVHQQQVLRPRQRRRHWTERHNDGSRVLLDAQGRPVTHGLFSECFEYLLLLSLNLVNCWRKQESVQVETANFCCLSPTEDSRIIFPGTKTLKISQP